MSKRYSDQAIAQAFYEQHMLSLRAGIKTHIGFSDGVFAKAKHIDAKFPTDVGKSYVNFGPGGVKVDLVRFLQTPEGRSLIDRTVTESISPSELWDAVSGNQGINPTKQEALDAARLCAEAADYCICEEQNTLQKQARLEALMDVSAMIGANATMQELIDYLVTEIRDIKEPA